MGQNFEKNSMNTIAPFSSVRHQSSVRHKYNVKDRCWREFPNRVRFLFKTYAPVLSRRQSSVQHQYNVKDRCWREFPNRVRSVFETYVPVFSWILVSNTPVDFFGRRLPAPRPIRRLVSMTPFPQEMLLDRWKKDDLSSREPNLCLAKLRRNARELIQKPPAPIDAAPPNCDAALDPASVDTNIELKYFSKRVSCFAILHILFSYSGIEDPESNAKLLSLTQTHLTEDGARSPWQLFMSCYGDEMSHLGWMRAGCVYIVLWKWGLLSKTIETGLEKLVEKLRLTFDDNGPARQDFINGYLNKFNSALKKDTSVLTEAEHKILCHDVIHSLFDHFMSDVNIPLGLGWIDPWVNQIIQHKLKNNLDRLVPFVLKVYIEKDSLPFLISLTQKLASQLDEANTSLEKKDFFSAAKILLTSLPEQDLDEIITKLIPLILPDQNLRAKFRRQGISNFVQSVYDDLRTKQNWERQLTSVLKALCKLLDRPLAQKTQRDLEEAKTTLKESTSSLTCKIAEKNMQTLLHAPNTQQATSQRAEDLLEKHKRDIGSMLQKIRSLPMDSKSIDQSLDQILTILADFANREHKKTFIMSRFKIPSESIHGLSAGLNDELDTPLETAVNRSSPPMEKLSPSAREQLLRPLYHFYQLLSKIPPHCENLINRQQGALPDDQIRQLQNEIDRCFAAAKNLRREKQISISPALVGRCFLIAMASTGWSFGKTQTSMLICMLFATTVFVYPLCFLLLLAKERKQAEEHRKQAEARKKDGLPPLTAERKKENWPPLAEKLWDYIPYASTYLGAIAVALCLAYKLRPPYALNSGIFMGISGWAFGRFIQQLAPKGLPQFSWITPDLEKMAEDAHNNIVANQELREKALGTLLQQILESLSKQNNALQK